VIGFALLLRPHGSVALRNLRRPAGFLLIGQRFSTARIAPARYPSRDHDACGNDQNYDHRGNYADKHESILLERHRQRE
jgi:hypothetical protein